MSLSFVRALWCGLAIFFVLGPGCQSEKKSGTATGGQVVAESSGKLDRGTFKLDIKETLGGEPTARNIAQELIGIGLVQHGYREVKDAKEARFIIQGESRCRFLKIHKMNYLGQEVHLEYQYEGEFAGTVTDTTTGEVEKIEIPMSMTGRNEEEDARRDICRYIGTLSFDSMINGRLLGNAKVRALIDAFANPKETRTYNQIAMELAAVGTPAIPYLIDALRDERTVEAKGDYPDLDEENGDLLGYIHVVDLALSEIFQAQSGLSIDSEEDYFYRVITGWTWAWEDRQGVPESHRIHREQRKTKVAAELSNASSE